MSLDELKKIADDNGVAYHPNIGQETLKKKLEDLSLLGSESTEEEVTETPAKEETTKNPTPEKTLEARPEKLTMAQRARIKENEARKVRTVTITDNDQRVNAHASTCIVNCSNMYFDLGTVTIPLNVKVQVAQGFLKVLERVMIPHHMKDPRDANLSITAERKRYAIQYH